MKKNLLLLGTGRVANSCASYLSRNPSLHLTVVGNNPTEVKTVSLEAPNSRTENLDVSNPSSIGKLTRLIQEADCVVSLLPVPLHPKIANLCISSKVHLVTASYVSPEIRSLDTAAKKAGITILNEVGLDPGMDHMSAMKIMDDIKLRGGKITGFSSVCGGLPQPDRANDNPLKYKFSWSPRGVLNASGNGARFLKEGEVINVEKGDLLSTAESMNVSGMNLECLPNRDSLSYAEEYDIPGATSIFRGTLRYEGFSKIMHGIKKLGLLEDVPCSGGTWEENIKGLIGKKTGACDLAGFFKEYGEKVDVRGVEEALDFLGMVNGNLKVTQPASLVGSFCDVLESKLTYDPEEGDMVAMQHDIRAEFSDGWKEHHTSSLVVLGDGEMSGMAKTVGFTAAIGAGMILNGEVKSKGVVVPMRPEIYNRGLELLEREGIVFQEECVRTPPGE